MRSRRGCSSPSCSNACSSRAAPAPSAAACAATACCTRSTRRRWTRSCRPACAPRTHASAAAATVAGSIGRARTGAACAPWSTPCCHLPQRAPAPLQALPPAARRAATPVTLRRSSGIIGTVSTREGVRRVRTRSHGPQSPHPRRQPRARRRRRPGRAGARFPRAKQRRRLSSSRPARAHPVPPSVPPGEERAARRLGRAPSPNPLPRI